jgi:predicted TIM-barrel fold metal-dependent hydrolase
LVNRRELLIAGAGVIIGTRMAAETKLAFTVPPGACDCHSHVFDPARFPFWSGRTYTPPPATVDQWRAVHQAIRMDRGVIVQASVYGTDNRCTLDALRSLGSRVRGVAVIGDDTTNAELDDLQRAGVRGVRINLETIGVADPNVSRDRFRKAIDRIAARGWHLQMFVRSALVETLERDVMSAPIPVVFDHFGGAKASAGVQDSGFQALLRLVKAGKAYTKISAAYRVSQSGPPDYADVAPLARALVSANPDRILWGSDWPHPGTTPRSGAMAVTPFLTVDDIGVLNQLAVWVPDVRVRRTILVDNPARLYGFER